jgi:thiosulfate/3-mercaptopyruvate sulfurtransferase
LNPEHFAHAAGRLGIGPGTHAVVYSRSTPMWATRLWWMLRHAGFDDVSVLDGGFDAWRKLVCLSRAARTSIRPRRS